MANLPKRVEVKYITPAEGYKLKGDMHLKRATIYCKMGCYSCMMGSLRKVTKWYLKADQLGYRWPDYA
jgi:hypothetical protein